MMPPEKIQRLENNLKTAKSPFERLHLLTDLAEIYTFTNVQAAKKVLDEAFKLLQLQDFPELLLKCHLYRALIENTLYQYDISAMHFRQALELAENHARLYTLIEINIDYIGTLGNLNNLAQAQVILTKTLRQLQSSQNPVLMARRLCREGFILLHLKDFDGSANAYFKAEKIFDEVPKDLLSLKDIYFQSLVYSALGSHYSKSQDAAKAADYHAKAVALCEASGIKARISWHYLNLGNELMNLDDYAKAEMFFEKILKTEDDASESVRAYAHANIGFCRYWAGEHDEALHRYEIAQSLSKGKNAEDYDNLATVYRWKSFIYKEKNNKTEQLDCLVKALQAAKVANNVQRQSEICGEVAEMMAKDGEYQSAYEYHELHTNFLRKHLESIRHANLEDLRYKYDLEKKKQETELLRLESKSLQMKALRAQMNPHFIFNALNAIQECIVSERNNDAASYLAQFSKLMRQSLEYSEAETIPLEDEIEFLKNYLNINKSLRFSGKMDFAINIDEEIEEDLLGVPTMIVQPYVENAIEHGLRAKKEGGFISIDFSLFDEDTILCVIADNGIGRARAREFQRADMNQKRHKSRGTAITEKRLEILNSSRKYDFFVQIDDLQDQKGKALGTRVSIKIPIVEISRSNENDNFEDNF